MENIISLTNEELELLKLLVEEDLAEFSPMPTIILKSLAEKLNLEKDTRNWIDRMLNKGFSPAE